jgi:hypothetical protein
MADEQKQTQETEVEALTRKLGERDQAFAPLKAELEQTKQALAAKTQETDAAASSARAAVESAAALTAALTDATAKYQALLVQTNPEIPADLIKGSTVAEIDASLASAKTIVQKVKESIEAQDKATPIPAGAPPRQAPDLESLSATEKIKAGLLQHDNKK